MAAKKEVCCSLITRNFMLFFDCSCNRSFHADDELSTAGGNFSVSNGREHTLGKSQLGSASVPTELCFATYLNRSS